MVALEDPPEMFVAAAQDEFANEELVLIWASCSGTPSMLSHSQISRFLAKFLMAWVRAFGMERSTSGMMTSTVFW